MPRAIVVRDLDVPFPLGLHGIDARIQRLQLGDAPDQRFTDLPPNSRIAWENKQLRLSTLRLPDLDAGSATEEPGKMRITAPGSCLHFPVNVQLYVNITKAVGDGVVTKVEQCTPFDVRREILGKTLLVCNLLKLREAYHRGPSLCSEHNNVTAVI